MLAAIGVRLWVPADAAPVAAPAQRPASVPPVAAVPSAPPPATGERALRIAAMDWPELRAEVASCRACGLCESRRNTVFGVGHQRSHWMIVGEAPGEQEDREGEPFVGAAGQLLDQMLAALRMSRDPAAVDEDPARLVYIANTLKCRPPRNRNPEPGEMAQCDPFLRRQLALVQPRIVLVMGRFAVNALLGTEAAIGRLRGQVHRIDGIPAVVTYHPAYLLRQPAEKAKAWEDLCLAAEVVAAAAA
jgi:DNA polymerase